MDEQEESKLKVVFAPGCFDSFEGTQEELDELVAEINRMIESGDFFEHANPVDLENMDPETIEKLENALESLDDADQPKRLLN